MECSRRDHDRIPVARQVFLLAQHKFCLSLLDAEE